MFRLKSKSGFTLIETLVALSLIIVMAGSTIIANRAISQNTSNARIQAEEQYLIDQEVAELKFLNNNNYSNTTTIYPADTNTNQGQNIYIIQPSNSATALIALNGSGISNSNPFYTLNLGTSQCSNSANLDSYLLTVSSSNSSFTYFGTSTTTNYELITVLIKSCANPVLQQSQSFFLTPL